MMQKWNYLVQKAEKEKCLEREYTDKKEKLESEISYLENKRSIEKSLSDMDKRESQRISNQLEGKRLELQSVNQEIEYITDKAKEAVVLLDRIKAFVSSFRLFAPTIEEYANQVEADKTIDAGNSFRGILYEIGKLLEAFKELIKERLCCFPRLMRWKTSKGEVAPVFIETSSGYPYLVYGYMNVETKEYWIYVNTSGNESLSTAKRSAFFAESSFHVDKISCIHTSSSNPFCLT